uniref:CBS domain-containing protein n=1 Tax=Flavobacterium sp. TaxID=239 RepID=UPI004048FD14
MQEAITFLRKDLQAFDYEDTIGSVQDFFFENDLSHFPVLEQDNYKGCLAQNDAETLDFQKTIKDFGYVLEPFFIRDNAHWLDVLEVFSKNETQIVPVLNADNTYIGYYELNDIFKIFNDTPFLNEPGNLLVVEKNISDYSMSQVAQIIESNNGKVLGFFISESNNQSIQITIKIMLGGINEIIQSFRRYGYEIISHHEDDNYLLNLKERSEYLKKYLDL